MLATASTSGSKFTDLYEEMSLSTFANSFSITNKRSLMKIDVEFAI